MFSSIEKIQKKPENVKKKISFSISLIITVIIFMIWISIFSSRFNSMKIIDKEAGEEQKTEIATPFESIQDGLDTIFSDIGEKFKQIKEKIK